jgi:hypothetical protein
LLITFWRIYQELGIPGTMWPPPNLRKLIYGLEEYMTPILDVSQHSINFFLLFSTVYNIHKFMKRKSEKNVAKRILVGYFGLRDLGKSRKYQRKLGFVASSLEVRI